MRYEFSEEEGAWMKKSGANVLAYVSKPYGDVVLVEWECGDVTILRDMAGAGVPSR